MKTKMFEEFAADAEVVFRDLLDGANDLIVIFSPEARLLYSNLAFQTALGYSDQELREFCLFDLLHPSCLVQCHEHFQELSKGAFLQSFETEFVRKDGRSIIFEGNCNRGGQQSGNIRGIFRDVTERQHAAEALRKSEEKYRNLIEQAPDAIFVAGPDLRIIDLNARATELTGYTREEILQMFTPDFIPPEDILAAPFRMKELRAGKAVLSERRVRRKDGTLFPVEIHARILSDGTLQGIVRDMSERRQAEEALRTKDSLLSESQRIAHIGSWLFDPTGQTTTWSDEMYRLYGVSPETFTTIGESFLDLVHADDRTVLTAWSAACWDGKQPPAIEFRAVLSDGSVRFIRAHGELSVATESRPAYITGTAQDITEHRQSEELVNGQKQVLEMIAINAPLRETLTRLIELIEAQSPEMICSILFLDADGVHIRHGAAPGLPDSFNRAIDGVVIGPSSGSCGTAMFRGKEVFVEDIQTDPLWADYRGLANDHGLRACWSAPICDAQKRVLGTFAIYYRQPGLPTERHRRLIDIATQTAAIAITRQRSEAALRESEGRYRALVEWSPEAITVHREGKLLFVNPAAVRMFGARSAQDLIGRPVQDLLESDFDSSSAAKVENDSVSGGAPMTEARFVKLDGSSIDVEIQGTSIVYDGEPAQHDTLRDITERKRAEAALRTSEEQLRALSARLQSAREEEGTRIAREIHDELGGALTGLKWDLEGIDKVLSEVGRANQFDEQREKIRSMTGLIESTINTVRRIASELRPGVLDDLGLVAAIEWQAQQFQARTGIQCDCVASADVVELNRERATAFFRILQEILTNVIRHASATRVDIELQEQDGELQLRVSDNGRGITAAEVENTSSLGLLGMQERALLVGGVVAIAGEAGLGTTVIARVPVS